MSLCVFLPLQSKLLYISSSTSFGPNISDKQIGYHFHILSQPHPCMIRSWQDIFPK